MRIAVWNTAFLGDALLTLPLIQAIKQHFPQAKIDYYVRKGLKELFIEHPDLEKVFEVDKTKKSFLGFCPLRSFKKIRALGQKIAERKYAIWVSAHTSLRSTLIAELSAAPIKIGYDSGILSRLVYTHTVQRRFNSLEEIERLLQLAKPLGINDFTPETAWPLLSLPATANNRAAAIWQDKVKGPVLGLHPGSVWPTKRWPAEYFAQTARLAAENGAQVMLFCGPGEEEQARQVKNLSGLGPEQLIDLSGQLNLPELAACIERLNCYLTNDSGPMHMAWALKTPTIAIFGPTTRALGFFPRGEDSRVLEVNLRCRPCGLHGHKKCPKKHHNCMREILPDQAWQAVAEKLSRKSESFNDNQL